MKYIKQEGLHVKKLFLITYFFCVYHELLDRIHDDQNIANRRLNTHIKQYKTT